MRKLTIQGGVHPAECKKNIAALAVENLPAPTLVIVPLQKNHLSRVTPMVKQGDMVKIGTILARPEGPFSVAAHAPVSGTIISLSPREHPSGALVQCAEIENDGSGEFCDHHPPATHWRDNSPEYLARVIAEAGVVDMGGSGLPVHSRLLAAREAKCDTLVVNCVESEPYLCANLRLALECPGDLIRGAQIMARIAGAQRIVLVITDRKKHEINTVLEKSISEFSDPVTVQLIKARSVYPQDDPHLLIGSITRKDPSPGDVGTDHGCTVQDAATAAAVFQAVENNRPVTRRFITVAGPVVGNPCNLNVPIGTPVGAVLEHCRTDLDKVRTVAAGGPMRGVAIPGLLAPVIDALAGVFATDKPLPGTAKNPCIRCGDCIRTCPMGLQPILIAHAVASEADRSAWILGIRCCIECGSCSYVCPSKINLVHAIQLGKRRLGIAPVIRAGFHGLTVQDTLVAGNI